MLPQLLFSLVFFGFVLFFSLRPGKITVWIGKIINPVFLVFLSVLLVAALCSPGIPLASIEPEAGYEPGSVALFSGFIEGYGTMDAIAGLAFGIVVIDIIRSMGVTEDEAVAGDVLRSGILTGILMAVIYVFTILMGARSRGVFATSANGGIAFGQIARYYLGTPGSVILAVTIVFACLKTALGLVTSCSRAFVQMFPNALSYRSWAILFSIFSCVVSNVGLSAMISWSLPVLMFIYPLTITLILLALTGKLFDHDRAVYVSVTAFTLCAALLDCIKTLPVGVISALRLEGLLQAAGRVLPMFHLNLGWVVPALAGLAVGLAIRCCKQAK